MGRIKTVIKQLELMGYNVRHDEDEGFIVFSLVLKKGNVLYSKIYYDNYSIDLLLVYVVSVMNKHIANNLS